ncbi:PE family protein [Mycobacteroides abscessus subsp. bolletii]|uniref:PE domain-containing protein n=1 Tax=Mycobacteroides abscessus TaxID=36809 RepID=UPI0009A6340B|nr:PE domain-containing protein [Mycobacteroides abscessus]SKS74255.1 PE family protein [Mycobacteroides abscessus subsp. bolletii]SKS82332.1 PE family protein [Mycobacteroides abscessus subsp. bolletii]
MILDVDPIAIAAQTASETAGTATQAGMLAGVAPAMEAGATMGIDEVSIAIKAAIAAHGAQFLAQTGVGTAQRGLFAAQTGVSGVVYAVSNALTAVDLAL